MANDLNQCNFIGRLGKDPESRFSPAGDAMCSFSIAVGWKTKEKDGTEWVRISTFGKLAEICQLYLKKGSLVFISGRFTTRKWQDKSGNDQYTTEIRADQMQMLGGKEASESEHRAAPRQGVARTATEPVNPQQSGDSFSDFDQDIQF